MPGPIEPLSIASAEAIGALTLLNGQVPTSLAEVLMTVDVQPEAATAVADSLVPGLDGQTQTTPTGRRQTVKGSNVKWEEP